MPIITLKTHNRGTKKAKLCLNGKNKWFLKKSYPPRPEGLSAFAMFASPCLTELKSDFPNASNPYFAMSLYLKIRMVGVHQEYIQETE